MRTIVAASLALATLLVTGAARAQDAKPNFTGTWTMDAAKSDFGPMPPPDSIVVVIDHKEPNIKMTTTQKSAMGDLNNDRTLTTDGKENINKIRTPAGDTDLKSTSKWDGRKLTTSASMVIQGMAAQFDDVWELSADGKLLTITRDIKTDSPFSTKTVYNKQ
jgi:hypothetical protein